MQAHGGCSDIASVSPSHNAITARRESGRAESRLMTASSWLKPGSVNVSGRLIRLAIPTPMVASDMASQWSSTNCSEKG